MFQEKFISMLCAKKQDLHVPNMPTPPLLRLDSCPDKWKTTIIENASECLQMYYFFRKAEANYISDKNSTTQQKHKICSRYIHFDEHNYIILLVAETSLSQTILHTGAIVISHCKVQCYNKRLWFGGVHSRILPKPWTVCSTSYL